MHLYGESNKYALGSKSLLRQVVFLRRAIGSIFPLGFFLVFMYLENYAASAVALFMGLLPPILHGYARLADKPDEYTAKIANFLSFVFSASTVAIIYLAQDVEFIYLIAYPITIAVYSASSYHYKWLALLLCITAITAILKSVLSLYTLMVFLTTYFLVLTFAHFFSIRLSIDNQTLSTLALKDTLTGLKNRRALEVDMSNPKVMQNIKSMVFLDIDLFKSINDKYGHVFGDEVLKAVALVIKNSIDKQDSAYRYGGEEFVVVTQGELNCQDICLNIKTEVEKLNLEGVSFTVSIGLKTVEEQDRVPLLQSLKDADNAMYHAKEQGRNRVFLFAQPMIEVTTKQELSL